MPPSTTEVHDTFVEIKIHTAKCDSCNRHNKNIIFRCLKCGQQCCTPCWQRKGGDDKHVLNGGDRGFIKGTTDPTEAAPEPLAVQNGPSASSSERVVRKRKRLVRRRQPVLEDENDEDDDKRDSGAADRENNSPPGSQSPRHKRPRRRYRHPAHPDLALPIHGSIPVRPESPLSIRAAADHLLQTAAPGCIQFPADTGSHCTRDANGLAHIVLAVALLERRDGEDRGDDDDERGLDNEEKGLNGEEWGLDNEKKGLNDEEECGLDNEKRGLNDEEEWGQDVQARKERGPDHNECRDGEDRNDNDERGLDNGEKGLNDEEERGLDNEKKGLNDEEEWGQDAQARSPLFVPDDLDSCSQTASLSQAASEVGTKVFVLDAEGDGQGPGAGSRVESMRWCYGMGKRDENGVRGWR